MDVRMRWEVVERSGRGVPARRMLKVSHMTAHFSLHDFNSTDSQYFRSHEIRMLMDKEGNEAKAKRACQQKVYQHHLDMEILEAEFHADHYVNFKDLVNNLYKVCLWMPAVSSASFSTNAINHWWLSDLALSSLTLRRAPTSTIPTPWRTALVPLVSSQTLGACFNERP